MGNEELYPVETKVLKDSADPAERKVYIGFIGSSTATKPTEGLTVGLALMTDNGEIWGYTETDGWNKIGSLGGGE